MIDVAQVTLNLVVMSGKETDVNIMWAKVTQVLALFILIVVSGIWKRTLLCTVIAPLELQSHLPG